MEALDLSPIRDKAMTAQEFDRRFRTDQRIRERVAGYTTFSLTHLKSGLTRRGFSVKPWESYQDETYPYLSPPHPSVYMDLMPDTYEMIFSERCYLEPYSPRDNRGYFSSWGVSEVYREMYGQEQRLTEEAEEIALRLVNWRRRFRSSVVKPRRGIDMDYLVQLTQHRGSYCGEMTKQQVEDTLLRYFGSVDKLIDWMANFQPRRGVQVIYGPAEDFIRFIRAQPKRRYQIDRAVCEMEFFGSIPGRLVSHVLPLGRYERSAFGIGK